LVDAGKYRQKTNQKQTVLKLSKTQKKQTTQNTAFETNLPWFSCLLWHSARKRRGLILQWGHTQLDNAVLH